MTDTDDRRESAAQRSMENASNSPVTDPASTEAQKELRSYEARLNNLLDDRDAIGEDIKQLAKEVKERGFNAAYWRKASLAKRKKQMADQALYDLRKSELSLYFIAILGEDSVQP